jgi:ribosome-associated protein
VSQYSLFKFAIMEPEVLLHRNLEDELIFASSRSSGPGGQNVNKVSTKVELRFNVIKSMKLSDSEKQLISEKLRKKINRDGELILISQSERSQLKNKKKVIEKFYILLLKALTIRSKRIPTAPTGSSREKRLEGKRRRSVVKRSRRDSEDSSTE